jgi:hypothetical protein
MPLAETGKIRTGQGWERRREFVLGWMDADVLTRFTSRTLE